MSSGVIIACASGAASSPRAIIRVFGERAHELLARACERVPNGANVVTVTRVRVGASGVDHPSPWCPCVVVRYDPPRSFTGEAGFELVVPGNPMLVSRIIAGLIAHSGAIGGPGSIREAHPGEFSARAYLAGKMTLEEAEGLAATIAATTEDELTSARSLLSGITGDRYREWIDEAATLLALVEAGVDFTDQEDVVAISPSDLRARLGVLARSIGDELGSASGSESDRGLARVVLAGAPNAGKSTLFNALLGRERVVTSPIAGSTRDVIAEEFEPEKNVSALLIDLAGLDACSSEGAGEVTISSQAQSLALSEIARADVVLHCDPSGTFARGPEIAPHARVLRVRTKGDLGVLSERGSNTSAADNQPASGVLSVCAFDGWHLGGLRRAIADALWSARGRGRGAAALVPRHRRTLALAHERLNAALALLGSPAQASARSQSVEDTEGTQEVRADGASVSSGQAPAPELIASTLREVVDHLGELVGRISPDDIIGRVFATFCVGK